MDGAPAAEHPSGDGESLPIDSALLKVLAADSRRDILRLLKQRRMTLTELSGQLNLKKATVLEHLKKLTDANLIRRMEDERLWVYYELTRQGLRIVSPGKTRFYLIMSATAVAGLLIGGIIVAVLVSQAPHVIDPKSGFGDSNTHTVSDQSGAPSASSGSAQSIDTATPEVGLKLEAPASAYRGLDDDITLRITRTGAPADGALLLASPTAAPTTLHSSAGVASLSAHDLDALAPANYTVQFAFSESNASWVTLGALDVRDAAITVDPSWVVEDTSVPLRVQLPATPTRPPVKIDGASIATQNTGGALTLILPARSAGLADVAVGRLFHATVQVVPNATVDVGAWDGSTWSIHLLRNGTPAPGARVAFASMADQLTGADGEARLAPTGAPAQLLRVTFSDGSSISRALHVDASAVTPLDPDLQVTALHATTIGDSLDVDTVLSNPASTDANITLTFLVDGTPVASRTTSVRAGDTGTTVTTRAPVALAPGAHNAEVLLAPGPLARITMSGAPVPAPPPSAPAAQNSTSSGSTAPTTTTPTTVLNGYQEDTSGRPAFDRSNAASTTFFVGSASPTVTTVAATTAGAPASYAKAPGAPLALVIVGIAALALALRRRKS